MNIQEIIENKGFYFDSFDPRLDLYHRIMHTSEPDLFIENFFSNYLLKKKFNFKKLHLVYEDIKLGQYHELHTHLIPANYQAVIWAPQDNYKGRAFIFGTKNNLNKFYPKFGDICFMKTNDLNFIHGVEPLLNDTLVRTLLISINYLGSNGEHLTVDHLNLKPI
jgi:hypothetical protein